MGKVTRMFADSKYHNFKLYEWVDENARWGLEIIRRPEGKKGWVKLPIRWTVERTFAWLSKCRGLLVRYEKKDGNYLGLIQMACGLLWYRRLHRMGKCDATQNTT